MLQTKYYHSLAVTSDSVYSQWVIHHLKGISEHRRNQDDSIPKNYKLGPSFLLICSQS
jgi:hypothetical protein